VDVFSHRDPLKFLDLSTVYRLPSYIFHIDTFNKIECYHPVDDCLNFDELLLVDLIWPQLQMCFFLNFPDCTIDRGLVLIDLALWKIKFFSDFVSGVMVDAKEDFV
jgi:hypothetical protein